MTTTATLVGAAEFGGVDALGVIVAGSDLEAALLADEAVSVWLDLVADGDEQRRLTLELTALDAREIVRLSGGGDVTLALDASRARELFDSDFEAHGLRHGLVIAAVVAAVAAPAGLASGNTTGGYVRASTVKSNVQSTHDAAAQGIASNLKG